MRKVMGPIYVVKQFERGIVEFFGKYKRFVGPGLHIQIPIVEFTRRRFLEKGHISARRIFCELAERLCHYGQIESNGIC